MSEDYQKQANEDLRGHQLPFSDKLQSAFIGHLFDIDTKLFRSVYGLVTKEWFGDPTHQKIWAYFEKIVAKRNKDNERGPPKPDEFKESTLLLAEPDDIRKKMFAAIDLSIQHAGGIGLSTLTDQLNTWMQAKILEETIVKGTGLFNQRKFAEAQEVLNNCYKKFCASQQALQTDDP